MQLPGIGRGFAAETWQNSFIAWLKDLGFLQWQLCYGNINYQSLYNLSHVGNRFCVKLNISIFQKNTKPVALL